jgi:hypothetical protein
MFWASLGKRAQPRPAPLRHLPILLGRPAEVPAELAAVPGERNLAGDHETLVGAELPREYRQQRELHARECDALHVGTRVSDLVVGVVLVRLTGKRERLLEPGLLDGAPSESAASVVDTREEALLERSLGVGAVREAAASPDIRDELERSLGEAFLQVVGAQPVTVHAQQDRSLRRDYERDELGGVGNTPEARKARILGRHALVSCARSHSPPPNV